MGGRADRSGPSDRIRINQAQSRDCTYHGKRAGHIDIRMDRPAHLIDNRLVLQSN